ncbi:uncharacterized protein LOC132728102, partial [Ruditapes philippinarum]|uniref:uncharacterized protein LOC132728102 n=1 Tax=Ruditapes philippinarum TaxID=129788 RepID=UPI00295AFFFB
MDNLITSSILVLVLLITTSEALQCLSCDNVVEARDCQRLATCGSHEICYVQRKIGTNLKQYYVLGCIDRNVCLGQQASMFAMGKRDTSNSLSLQVESRAIQSRDKNTRDSNGDMNLCTQCCDSGDECNKDLCGSPPSTNLRCLSCLDKEDPKDCESVTECGRDQFCYVHKGLNPNTATYSIRYDLGCMGKLQCTALKNAFSSSCVVCCDHTDLCNYAACDNWN